MHPLKTYKDTRKLKWQYEVGHMPKKRQPTRVDRSVWEKVTEGRAGISRDSVVDKVCKGI